MIQHLHDRGRVDQTLPPVEPEPEPEPKPDETWAKADIVAWLTDNGIEASTDELKADLLGKVSEVN